MLRDLRLRLRAAVRAFMHAKQRPDFAVIYDLPICDDLGTPTGDTVEEFYEAFADTNEAYELFRMAYRKDDRVQVQNPRLVMILGPIDDYAGNYPVPQ